MSAEALGRAGRGPGRLEEQEELGVGEGKQGRPGSVALSFLAGCSLRKQWTSLACLGLCGFNPNSSREPLSPEHPAVVGHPGAHLLPMLLGFASSSTLGPTGATRLPPGERSLSCPEEPGAGGPGAQGQVTLGRWVL